MEGLVCCVEMFGHFSRGNGVLWKNFVGGMGSNDQMFIYNK